MAKVKSISGIKHMAVTHVLVMLQWNDSNTRLRYTLHALPKSNKKISAGVDACVFWGILIICFSSNALLRFCWYWSTFLHGLWYFGWKRRSVVATNIPSQDSFHPDDQIQPRYVTPGFKERFHSCLSKVRTLSSLMSLFLSPIRWTIINAY